MKLADLNGKQVVFVGVGKGRSFDGFKDVIARSGIAPASLTGVDKKPGDDPLGFLKEYDQPGTVFVKNEGIPGREMPVPYVSPTALFFDEISGSGATVIGITGTKGKTTTTSLVGEFLKAAGKKVIVAGNIGNSVLHYVDQVDADTVLVLELSSHQLADLKVSPHIGAVTNLYEDHLDYYGSLEAYWEAKHSIVKFMGQDDYFVYNPDFALLNQWADGSSAHKLPLDTNETIDMSKTGLIGDHNRLNALMARSIARLLDVSDEVCQAALDKFQPVRHRLQTVKTVNEVTYIDDAIASQPEAAIAGITAVAERIGKIGCILLGGQDRDYDFSELMNTLAEQKVPNLVLFPDTTEKMKAALPAGYQPEILETSDMAEAVAWASDRAPHGSVVMLSTAAPSYSVWKDFEEKGDLFQEAVAKL